MVIYFPDHKIPTRPNLARNRNIKRDAILINNQFVCPLCMMSDYIIIKTELDKVEKHLLLHTGRCRQCGILIRYYKPTPDVVNKV